MAFRRCIVIGGAASGKSAHAETLVRPRPGGRRIYVATAQAFDAEMEAKIARHRTLRGAGWHTTEAPQDLGPALAEATGADAVLIDCATMWLSNHLLAGTDLDAAETALMTALADCAAPVVVVTNELGLSIVPENALARRFREAQGRLNQRLAAGADRVDAVIAGLPVTLKGGA